MVVWPVSSMRIWALRTYSPVFGLKTRPMIVTYHPAYLLRSPAEKRKAWGDLVLAMQTFEQLGSAAQ